MSKPLSPTAHALARVNALVNGLTRLAETDNTLAEMACGARMLSSVEHGLEMLRRIDAGEQVGGWTREELIIAVDAKMPKNQVPFYLAASCERVTHRTRASANSDDNKPAAQGFVLPGPAAPPQGEAKRLTRSEDDE